jgi:hypothetical protein
MPLLHTKTYTRFCVPGHRVLEFELGGALVFRGKEMGIKECVRILREDWDICEESEDEGEESNCSYGGADEGESYGKFAVEKWVWDLCDVEEH